MIQIADLKNFRNSVIAAKQFADDLNSIMQSVVDLIERTIDQVEQVARNNEGRDRISRPPPNTDDPIDDPRVTSPRALSNAALPISLPRRWTTSGSKPICERRREALKLRQYQGRGGAVQRPKIQPALDLRCARIIRSG
jgi:Asp-tRNA(Asn)/Glu-tRNA(Gln) amidotransferase C subunit